MAASEKIALVERFLVGAVGEHITAAAEALLTEDFYLVTPASVHYGRADCVLYLEGLRKSLKDFRMKPRSLSEQADTIVAGVELCGTPVDEFLGLPPSRKRFEIPSTFTFRFTQDRIKSLTVNYELAELLKRD